MGWLLAATLPLRVPSVSWLKVPGPPSPATQESRWLGTIQRVVLWSGLWGSWELALIWERQWWYAEGVGFETKLPTQPSALPFLAV